MKAVRFAIIGCGMMGQRHAEILRATPGAEITVVLDRDLVAAEKIAQDATVADSYEATLAAPNVDAVVLCLPSGLHAEYGIQAARAGKHVVTEKPIDIEPEAGERLARTCADARVQCAVISQNRFADGNAALKAALDNGTAGKPVLVDASVRWFRHDAYYANSDWRGRVDGEGGGVIMNQAIHTIDLLLWMFGEPEVIHGLTSINRANVMETEDTAVAVMQFPRGILCTLSASTSAYPGFEERIAVYGPQASAVVESGKLTYWKHADEKPQPEPPAFEPPTPGLSPKFTLFQRQYRNILAAITGGHPIAVTPDESVAVVRTARAIYGKLASV